MAVVGGVKRAKYAHGKALSGIGPAHLIPRASTCTTGCPLLDATLEGGLRTGCVHEIVGESNCGKTQLCLQLLLTCQWSKSARGLECKSLYINTEGINFSPRLQEFAEFQASKGYLGSAGMDNIFVEKCMTEDPTALIEVLHRAQKLLQHHGVKLIVIDSIANAFKGYSSDALDAIPVEEGGKGPGGNQRQFNLSQHLHRTMTLLKKYASDYDACIVLTNHVTDFIGENAVHRASQAVSDTLHTSGRRVNASLGTSFAQSVTCRYFLSRLHAIKLNQDIYDTSGCVRSFNVVFSPYQRARECKYIINQSGVWGIPDNCLEHRQPEAPEAPDAEDGGAFQFMDDT